MIRSTWYRSVLAAVATCGAFSLPAHAEDRPRLKVERAERIEADLQDRRAARDRDEQQNREALENLAATDPQTAKDGSNLLDAGGVLGAWQDDAAGRAAQAYERLPECNTPEQHAAVRRELLEAMDECEQLEPLQQEVNSGLRKILPGQSRDEAAAHGRDNSAGQRRAGGQPKRVSPERDDNTPTVPEPVVVAEVQNKGQARFHPGGFCVSESLTYIRGLEIYARLTDLLGQPIDRSFFEIRPPAEHRFEQLKGLLDRLYDGGPGRSTPAYDGALNALRQSLRAHANNCARILQHNRNKPVPPPENERTPPAVGRYLELADAYDREADALEAERAEIEAELQRHLDGLRRFGRGTITPGAWPQR